MRITASVVTYKTDRNELIAILDTLAASGIERIYVIDNSPTDALSNVIDSHPQALLIEYTPRHDNPGYGAAHNIALRKAIDSSVDYHLVVNSDIMFDRDVIGKIARFMETHPDVGQLQPRIINPDGTEQYTTRLLPTPFDVFGRRFLPSAFTGNLNRRYLLKARTPGKPLNIPYHQGSFMFLRISALKKVGLFDERYFMYPEDIDLTRRMHELYVTLYWPEVTVVHDHRASSYHNIKMTWVHIRNMIRYFNKWGWWHDPQRKWFNDRLLADII